MNIDLMVWAPDRETFVSGMLANNMMVETVDGPVAAPDVAIDEIGQIIATPATYDAEGNELTPAVVIDGYHVNLRAYGQFAKDVTYQLPQYDEEGIMLSVFERTYLLHLVPDLEWTEITDDGVPAGWVGVHGVKLYDPSVVSTPARVWA